MNELVSIVIPIYNVENYLSQCVDSVVAQTYPNLDIVLVDDGSTDSSSAICDDYANKYNNITVIHKVNGGISDTRNVGIEKSKGEYILFVDGDDWVHKDYVRQLIDFALNNDCEIVQGNFYYAYESRELKQSYTSNDFCLGKTEVLNGLLESKIIHNFVWGKLFKSSLIKEIKFPVNKLFEDAFWTYQVIDRCNNYGIVSTPLYYYRQRESSLTGRFSYKNFDLIEAYIARAEYYQKHYPSLMPKVKLSLERLLWSFYPYCKGNIEYSAQYDQSLIEYRNLMPNPGWRYYIIKRFNVLYEPVSLVHRAVGLVRRYI